MKKKVLVVAIGIIILLIAVVTYFFISDKIEEQKLNKEIEKIEKLDLTKDNVDMKVYTKGDYAVVEKTVKTYLKDFSDKAKETVKLMEDKKIQNMLIADNYEKDGPEFKESLSYISDVSQQINSNIESLIKQSTKEEIIKIGEKMKLDDYYLDLYKDIMFEKLSEQEFQEVEAELTKAKEIMNNLFDIENKVLTMLKENKGHWEIKNNQILFDSNDLLNQYNTYLSKLK